MVKPAAMSSALVAVAKFMLCCVCCENCRRWGRCLSIEQQGSDCLNACLLCFDGDPCHGFALVGAAPDHSILL